VTLALHQFANDRMMKIPAQGFQWAGMMLLASLVLTLVFSQGHLNRAFGVICPLMGATGVDLLLIGFIKKGAFTSSRFYSNRERVISRYDEPQMFWGTILAAFYISHMVAIVFAISNW
jgi:hypothetical protein